MVWFKVNFLIFVFFVISFGKTYGWRTFWKGHRDGGNLIPPHTTLDRDQLPPDQWFDQQLDHFNKNNDEIWKQVSPHTNQSVFFIKLSRFAAILCE